MDVPFGLFGFLGFLTGLPVGVAVGLTCDSGVGVTVGCSVGVAVGLTCEAGVGVAVGVTVGLVCAAGVGVGQVGLVWPATHGPVCAAVPGAV